MIFTASKKISLFLFLFLILSGFSRFSLFAQFSGYTSSESSAYNAGLFSIGAGLRHQMSNLYGNTSFLMNSKTNFVDANLGTSQSRGSSSSFLLGGGGFYRLGEKWGVGIRFKPIYNRFFEADNRMENYALSGIVSYELTEYLYLGVNLGPTMSNRPGGYSSYSWNLSVSVGLILGKWNFGWIAESPGLYRFENYLGSEKLKERLPERMSVGAQYQINSEFFLYGELVRTFWERAMFSQNGIEEKPPFLLRDSYTGSLGIGYLPFPKLSLLTGITSIAYPSEEGVLYKSLGASIGASGEILPSVIGNGFWGGVYLQQTGLTGMISPYARETKVGFQFTYAWETEQEKQEDIK